MGRTPASARIRPIVDPRLLIGIGLVVASVVGVVALVTAVDDRTIVVAAPASLVPGDRVERADLLDRSVGLAEATALYLRADDIPDDGLVVVAPVRQGELIPRSAVGAATDVDSTSIVVETAGRLSSDALAGAAVELWSSPADAEGRGFDAPTVLVADALVVRVLESDGLMSGSSAGAVELLVPRDEVARILKAQADGDALAVVAAGLPVRAQ